MLLYGGRALVADFGLEPAVGVAELPRRSMPGSVPGTPEYMSPEQAQGDTDCDGRSDVYSLACIVYEMIWGRPPFMGPPSLVLRRQLSAEPMPLCCRLPGVPHGLAAAVSRALAKEPAHRFPSAGAFAAALRDGCDSLEACRPSDRVTAERPIDRSAFSAVPHAPVGVGNTRFRRTCVDDRSGRRIVTFAAMSAIRVTESIARIPARFEAK